MNLSLTKIVGIIQAKTLSTISDCQITAVSTDSRTIQPGDLYVAIRGDDFDGHDFVKQAKSAGAVAAIVDHKLDIDLPQLQVINTRHAYGAISNFHRKQYNLPVIGITGSCGKTTTKAVIASIMQTAGETLATEGTLNNDMGVPPTLLGLDKKHAYAVIEMGANHSGEIAYLTHLVEPTIALITCIAAVHTEFFGDLDGVACAKGEIYQGLSDDGVAIINADDDYADFLIKRAGEHKVILFGHKNSADVMAKDVSLDQEGRATFTLTTSQGEIAITMPLIGKHNVTNALAAAAVASVLDISLSQIKQGIESVPVVSKRLVSKVAFNGAQVIDDSYNANPTSVKAAIDVLKSLGKIPVLVIGDMAELGESVIEYHEQVGEYAKSMDIPSIYCYGEQTVHTAKAFGEAANHYDNQADLIKDLKANLLTDHIVLVKGSKCMKMWNITEALVGDT